jgi:hypothetical protein
MLMSRLTAAVVLLGGPLGGCGDEPPGAPKRREARLDEGAAKYRGVGLGDPQRKVIRVFGRPAAKRDPTGPLAAGDDPSEVGLPSIIAPPPRPFTVSELRRGVHRYREASFRATRRHGVYAFSVVALGTVTNGGVRIGDPLDEVRTRYPELRCGVRNRGTEYAEYPYCAGRLGRRRYIWFGQDPVRSISMAVSRMG